MLFLPTESRGRVTGEGEIGKKMAKSEAQSEELVPIRKLSALLEVSQALGSTLDIRAAIDLLARHGVA